ncbi:hypothetical protein L332_05670 [Agrococcus pavilionensis RW1]|uniref:Fungal lipase-like domain-containing protein n=1 Tax=Agrococcus pavilionensis RW1 TaxID=1330458 RepID=U1LNJ6_9MICO|nr:alpha/beta hydrolase [Agrococcus pavilionensis]ERG63944.1 hypothetical protein L332_05670 [Agrococcus pavilionensis RW1]
MTLEQLSGEWQAVEGHGDAYLRTAAAIEQAIEHLLAIRDEDATVARAFDRVREDAAEVSGQLGSATSRYRVTGQALVDYAEELRAAQQSADAAIDEWRIAEAARAEALAERDRLAALASGADAAAALERAAAEQQSLAELHDRRRAEAEADWRAAAERKRRAAEEASARIRAEIERSAIGDSWWDDVRGAVSGLLDAIRDAVVDALAWLGAAVLAAIGALVAAALAIALAATGLVGALLAGVALALVATWVANGGAAAFVGTLARTGSIDAALVSGTIAWLHGTLPGVVDWLIAGDAGAPVLLWSGPLEPRTGIAGSAGDLLARLQADNRAVDAHAGAPDDAALPDPDASTMVTVTAVTGADGSTAYRVSIPSTQVWRPGSSSIDDVHSDVAAKLGTAPTQLEQAVALAMAEAGVPPGSSVLLSGWSLGGITAANLAADPAFTAVYDVDAVIVAGAPIDDAPIPTHIPVLSIEHAGGGLPDPVPLAEAPGKLDLSGDPNRLSVRVPPPPGAGLVPHEGLAYQVTMQRQGDAPGPAATWMALHDLDRFFVGVERAHASIFERGR